MKYVREDALSNELRQKQLENQHKTEVFQLDLQIKKEAEKQKLKKAELETK